MENVGSGIQSFVVILNVWHFFLQEACMYLLKHYKWCLDPPSQNLEYKWLPVSRPANYPTVSFSRLDQIWQQRHVLETLCSVVVKKKIINCGPAPKILSSKSGKRSESAEGYAWEASPAACDTAMVPGKAAKRWVCVADIQELPSKHVVI